MKNEFSFGNDQRRLNIQWIIFNQNNITEQAEIRNEEDLQEKPIESDKRERDLYHIVIETNDRCFKEIDQLIDRSKRRVRPGRKVTKLIAVSIRLTRSQFVERVKTFFDALRKPLNHFSRSIEWRVSLRRHRADTRQTVGTMNRGRSNKSYSVVFFLEITRRWMARRLELILPNLEKRTRSLQMSRRRRMNDHWWSRDLCTAFEERNTRQLACSANSNGWIWS